MGEVFSAWDPVLEREVAIKRLHPHRFSGSASIRRFVREARAIARINHVNVLPVFDAGWSDGQGFLVMQQVDASSMRQWLNSDRPRRSRLLVLERAAAGLAAAHRQGIVHRDFKPENVLVDRDRHTWVMDFGLAVEHAAHETSAGGHSEERANPEFTTVAGTPAYMAPEQHLGLPGSVASDVYALAITSYETLVGRRPFQGSTLARLIEQKMGGAPPRPAGMPRRVWSVLERGLAVEPDQRPPSAEVFVAELRRAYGGRRHVAVAALASIAIGLGVLGTPTTAPASSPGCDDPSALVTNWPQRSAAVASGRGASLLLAHAERWAQLYTEACDGPSEHRDAQLQCLQRQLQERDELLAALPIDARAADVVRVAEQLGPPSTCTGVHSVFTPLTPAQEHQLAAARRGVRVAKGLLDDAEPEQALRTLGGVEQRLEHLPPIDTVDSLRIRAASLYDDAGDAAGGARRLHRLYLEALGQGRPHVAQQAAVKLIYVEGVSLGNPAAGHRHNAAALALQVRDGLDPLVNVQRLTNLASVSFAEGSVARAVEVLVLARAELQALELSDPGRQLRAARSTARVEGNLAAAWMHAGDFEAARDAAQRAIDAYRSGPGDEATETGRAYMTLAMALLMTGELDAAQRAADEGLRTVRASVAPASPSLAPMLRTAATIAYERGDLVGHRLHLEEVRGLFPPSAPAHWDASIELAQGMLAEGLASDALQVVMDALPHLDASDSVQGQSRVAALRIAAHAHSELDQHPQAIEAIERAQAALVGTALDVDVLKIPIWLSQAQIYSSAGRLDASIRANESAYAATARAQSGPDSELAVKQLVSGLVSRASESDLARARAVMTESSPRLSADTRVELEAQLASATKR